MGGVWWLRWPSSAVFCFWRERFLTPARLIDRRGAPDDSCRARAAAFLRRLPLIAAGRRRRRCVGARVPGLGRGGEQPLPLLDQQSRCAVCSSPPSTWRCIATARSTRVAAARALARAGVFCFFQAHPGKLEQAADKRHALQDGRTARRDVAVDNAPHKGQHHEREGAENGQLHRRQGANPLLQGGQRDLDRHG